MTPLFALGVNGLPDLLTTDFYSYLGNGDLTNTALRITLVQVYASADGQFLGSCSLPCKLGLYVDVHLLDDGKHLLLTSRPNAPSLSAYFQAKSASPEAQAQLARHSIPLMIMNFRTGQIARQWPGQGWCSLDRQDERRFLHRSADVEPVLQWASSRPYRKPRFHVIDTREMSMLELVRPEYEYAESFNHDNDGYLLQTIQLIRDGSIQASAPANAFTSYDKSGKQLSEKLLQMDGSTRAQLIRSQRQVIVYHSDDYPWAETWRNWKQRWPWLSIFPLEDRPRCWVWDIDSNQQLLVLTSRLSNLEASPDGKYLLVGKADFDDHLTELSVYALPLPLVPWWKVWLPRIAAAASFAIIWLLVMKLKRPQRQPTADRVS